MASNTSAASLVARVDPPLHFLQVARAQVGEQPAVSKDMAVELLLRILAAEAELDQFAHRQPARSGRGRTALPRSCCCRSCRPFAMRRNGNPAAHVHHDQPQRLVGPPLLARKSPRHGLGVQRMADAVARRPAANRRGARIPATRPPSPGPRCTRSPRPPAQTASASTAPRFDACSPRRARRSSSTIASSTRYVPHLIGGSSPPRPATAANSDLPCIRPPRGRCSIIPARYSSRSSMGRPPEPRKLLIPVADGPHHLRALARVDAELGRCRSGIDDQNPAALVGQLVTPQARSSLPCRPPRRRRLLLQRPKSTTANRTCRSSLTVRTEPRRRLSQ